MKKEFEFAVWKKNLVKILLKSNKWQDLVRIFFKAFLYWKIKVQRCNMYLILKVLPRYICYYCFCCHIQSLVTLESVIVETAPYFEHTASLTYSLWYFPWHRLFSLIFKQCNLEPLVGTFGIIYTQQQIQVHSICSSFWLLADESRDLSQVEKKITVGKCQSISKGPFKVFTCTKIWTKIFLYFCPSL